MPALAATAPAGCRHREEKEPDAPCAWETSGASGSLGCPMPCVDGRTLLPGKLTNGKATTRPGAGRSHFGHPTREEKPTSSFPDLLSHARRAGLLAPMQHEVTGSAALDINVTGPRGTRDKAPEDGGAVY